MRNTKAWALFQPSTDRAELAAAAEWMKRVLAQDEAEGETNGARLDTYANLLYKPGQVEEAIRWEEKAVAVAGVRTYANRLYKVGHVADAIAWEEQALQLAREANNSDEAAIYQAVLDQMKKGEPTWPQR